MPISSIINAVSSTGNTLVNHALAEQNRKRNFYWNEKAADAADQRQRKQYKDLYSPQSMVNQYAAAGLSPSMMMSGGAPAVGQSSAQGNMSGGLQGTYPSGQIFDPLAAAQMALINAETKKTNVETQGQEIDNTINDLKRKLEEQSFIAKSEEINLLYTYLVDSKDPSKKQSLSEYAVKFNNYQEFWQSLKNEPLIEEMTKDFMQTERGQRILRDIYETSHKIEKDVAQIIGDKEYANLMLDVVTKLDEKGFAELSAQVQISELNQIVQASNLEADKKETINKIFESIKNEDVRAIAMIIYMLADRYLGSVNANISNNTSKSTNTNTSFNRNYNHNM